MGSGVLPGIGMGWSEGSRDWPEDVRPLTKAEVLAEVARLVENLVRQHERQVRKAEGRLQRARRSTFSWSRGLHLRAYREACINLALMRRLLHQVQLMSYEGGRYILPG